MNLKLTSLQEKIKEALATPKGKGMAAGLMLIIVILMVLLVMTVAIPMGPDGNDTVEPVKPAVTPVPPFPSQTTETASSAAGSETTTTVEDTTTIGNIDDLRLYKDPFMPLVETTSTTGNDIIFNGESTTTAVAIESESISLKSISKDEDTGESLAMVVYKDNTYEVGAGDQVGESPYKVVDIGDGSVTLLYGDDRLTLQVGDEVIK